MSSDTKKRSYSEAVENANDGNIHVVSKNGQARVFLKPKQEPPYSPLSQAVSVNMAKRARANEHCFSMKRAIDQLAAPGGISFDPNDIFVLLGFSFRVGTELSTALQNVKTALNEIGSNSQERRDRATKVVAALICMQKPYDDLRKLESFPMEPDTEEHKQEIKRGSVSLQRKLKLLSLICEKDSQPLYRHVAVQQEQLKCIEEAKRLVEKQALEVAQDIDQENEELSKAQEAQNAVNQRLHEIDNAIQSALQRMSSSGDVGITSLLDAISSSDPLVVKLTEKRKECKKEGSKVHNQLKKAENQVQFAKALKALVKAVRNSFTDNLESSLKKAAEYRGKLLNACETSLETHIPQFTETIYDLMRSHQERQQAAQQRVDKKSKSLKEHINLFGDEAPEARRSIERKIEEFKSIVIKSISAVKCIAHEMKSFFNHLLYVPAKSSLPTEVLATANSTKNEAFSDLLMIDLSTGQAPVSNSLSMVPARLNINYDFPRKLVKLVENALNRLNFEIIHADINATAKQYLEVCAEIQNPTKKGVLSEEVETKDQEMEHSNRSNFSNNAMSDTAQGEPMSSQLDESKFFNEFQEIQAFQRGYASRSKGPEVCSGEAFGGHVGLLEDKSSTEETKGEMNCVIQ